MALAAAAQEKKKAALGILGRERSDDLLHPGFTFPVREGRKPEKFPVPGEDREVKTGR